MASEVSIRLHAAVANSQPDGYSSFQRLYWKSSSSSSSSSQISLFRFFCFACPCGCCLPSFGDAFPPSFLASFFLWSAISPAQKKGFDAISSSNNKQVRVVSKATLFSRHADAAPADRRCQRASSYLTREFPRPSFDFIFMNSRTGPRWGTHHAGTPPAGRWHQKQNRRPRSTRPRTFFLEMDESPGPGSRFVSARGRGDRG